MSSVFRSLGESRNSPSVGMVRPFASTSVYGRRQGCAHTPRFALRPPTIELNRHWPDSHMHKAPCANTSSSMPSRAKRATCSTDSSRARVTREKPILRAISKPRGPRMFICVEACRGSLDSSRLSSAASPMS